MEIKDVKKTKASSTTPASTDEVKKETRRYSYGKPTPKKYDQEKKYPETIGGRIKELLDSKGLTQENLAEMLDVNNAVVSRIVNDYRLPTTEQVAILCKKLHESADFILFGKRPGGISQALIMKKMEFDKAFEDCVKSKAD